MASAKLLQVLQEAQAAFAIEEAGAVSEPLARRRDAAVQALEQELRAHPPQASELVEAGALLRDLAVKTRYHLKWGALRKQLDQDPAAPQQEPSKPATKLDIVF